MEALNDYLIVRKDTPGRVTKSGIFIPDFESSPGGAPYTGVVVSVGACVKGGYSEGDRVVYNDVCDPYAVERDGEVLLAVRETDVAAVIGNKHRP